MSAKPRVSLGSSPKSTSSLLLEGSYESKEQRGPNAVAAKQVWTTSATHTVPKVKHASCYKQNWQAWAERFGTRVDRLPSIGETLGRQARHGEGDELEQAEDLVQSSAALYDGGADSQEVEPMTGEEFRRLMQVPPNLLTSTFDQAAFRKPSEVWLESQIEIFDRANRAQRRKVLQDFLAFMAQSFGRCSGIEDLFAAQAFLFLIRLTSWFSVTLPILYELPLQLNVFLAFLDYREEAFIRAFFESGVVSALLHALTVACDASDEVRALAIAVLHRLACGGPQCKELLCSKGLLPALVECVVSGGLRWGSIRQAGMLLEEVFHDNPGHQVQVVNTIKALMAQSLALAKRIGTQTMSFLLAAELKLSGTVLEDPSLHKSLADMAAQQLRHADLHIGADAFRLIGRLLATFRCDELFFGHARQFLLDEKDTADDWLRVEAATMEWSAANQPLRYRGATAWLHRCVANALSDKAIPPSSSSSQDASSLGMELLGPEAGDDPVMMAKAIAAELDENFCGEAAYILRWGLIMTLNTRNPDLCRELVQSGGLTELFLRCLLDPTKPVRQAVALVELHKLRLLSQHAQQLSEAVMSEAMLAATTVEHFSASASQEQLARARYRLRNLQCWTTSDGQTRFRVCGHGADEVELQQRLIQQKIQPIMDGAADPEDAKLGSIRYDVKRSTSAGDESSVFLTSAHDGASADDSAESSADAGASAHGEASHGVSKAGQESGDGTSPHQEQDETQPSSEDVPRQGHGRYDIRRVPAHSVCWGGEPLLPGPGGSGGAGDYQVVMGPAEEVSKMGSLVSLLIDLADLDASAAAAADNFPQAAALAAGRSVDGLYRDISVTTEPSVFGDASASEMSLGDGSTTSSRRRHLLKPPKASHRITKAHKRANVMRPVPMGSTGKYAGSEAAALQLLPLPAPPAQLLSRSDSECTQLSLHMAGAEKDHLFAAPTHALRAQDTLEEVYRQAKNGYDRGYFRQPEVVDAGAVSSPIRGSSSRKELVHTHVHADCKICKHHHESHLSLADTSVGLELSDELSQEMPSDWLGAGGLGELEDGDALGQSPYARAPGSSRHKSVGDPFEHIDIQARVLQAEESWATLGSVESQFDDDAMLAPEVIRGLKPLEGPPKHPNEVRLHKCANVALVEVLGQSADRQSAGYFRRQGRHILHQEVSDKVVRKVLHVAAAPYHDCAAFDRLEAERSRVEIADKITKLLHPEVRARFEDIHLVGGFNRKGVIKSDKGLPLSAREYIGARRSPRPVLPPILGGPVERELAEDEDGEEEEPEASVMSARRVSNVMPSKLGPSSVPGGPPPLMSWREQPRTKPHGFGGGGGTVPHRGRGPGVPALGPVERFPVPGQLEGFFPASARGMPGSKMREPKVGS
eukprot:TRINITY_DN112958_c0_g1_i1.p1 TRINITY_DN112958_c0_g1~~TRINITY_DN112958_c0_g1_i1.p1  ORF type:complete len:1407 (+),score=318.78 TRINITY_DN112958_c0_g1_i1:81-4223(+)